MAKLKNSTQGQYNPEHNGAIVVKSLNYRGQQAAQGCPRLKYLNKRKIEISTFWESASFIKDQRKLKKHLKHPPPLISSFKNMHNALIYCFSHVY